MALPFDPADFPTGTFKGIRVDGPFGFAEVGQPTDESAQFRDERVLFHLAGPKDYVQIDFRSRPFIPHRKLIAVSLWVADFHNWQRDSQNDALFDARYIFLLKKNLFIWKRFLTPSEL